MKKYLRVLVLFVAALLMVGCEDNTPQVDTTEYYVRYSVSFTPYISANPRITYADVSGTKTSAEHKNTALWEVTIGPVKKGFNAYVSYYGEIDATAKIEVCKNSGPFVLKATGKKQASYKIDF